MGRIGGAPVVCRLDGRDLLVGSAESCGLRLEVRGVSRRHALVRWGAGAWIVEDLGSRNGTFVNGLQVVSHVLGDGDELRFGPVALQVSYSPSEDDRLAIVADAPAVPAEQTDWCGPTLPVSAELDLARHLLRLTVGSRSPDVASAVRLLVHHCGAMGATLGEWVGWGEPDVLAQHGDVGTLVEHPDLYEVFGGILRDGETHTCYRSGVLSTEPPLLYCGFRRPSTTLLALVVRGGAPGIVAAAGEILLRLVD